MSKKSSVTVGVFTDLHHSIKQDDEIRFFSKGMCKLRQCLKAFKKSKVDFMVCLGDLTDYQGYYLSTQTNLFENLAKEIIDSDIPFFMCLGNHDVCANVLLSPMQLSVDGSLEGYYSFSKNGFHFVVLNTNYNSDHVAYSENTMQWDKLYVSQIQIDWLEQDLKNTNLPTIVFTHANIDKRFLNNRLDPHIVLNYEHVQKVLSEANKVKLVLQGHCHSGASSLQNGILYITVPALVDGPKVAPALLLKCNEQNICTQHIDASIF